MQPFARFFVRTYFLSLLLVALGLGLQKLFGNEIRGPWWLWVGVVPAIIAVTLSLPLLFAQLKKRR